MTATPLSPPLVLRFGAFGDMLLLLPFLRVLVRRYGQPSDVIASGPWSEPLLALEPSAGSVGLLSSRNAPYWFNRDQRQLVAWLRTRPPGPVYLCEGDDKSEALMRRANVASEWILTMRDFPREANENILERFHRFANATPAALSMQEPAAVVDRPSHRVLLPDSARADLDAWLAGQGLGSAPLVLLQPGNKRTMRRGARDRSSNVKYWPEEHWAEVAQGVCKAAPSARVLICGSAQEAALAGEIRARCDPERVRAAAGELPIPRLLALLARAHSMISVDTGPAHAAAAMGCPLAVMYANTETAYYAPTSTGATVRKVLPSPSFEHDEFPMRSIAPAAVLAEWGRLEPRA